MARQWFAAGRLAAVALAAIATLGAAQSAPTPERRVIRVRAERFSFSPSDIRVVLGETVELRIRSDDTAHGFHIVGTDADVIVPKRGRGEVSVVFAASTAGTFEFECVEMCGAGHDFMRGQIRVIDPASDPARGRR